MHYKFLILYIVFSLLLYNFCIAQQPTKTSFECNSDKNLSISLNGRVKAIQAFTCYTFNNQCDTISYTFLNNGIPTKIVKKSNAVIFNGNAETVFDFDNGNLISIKYIENFNLLTEKRLKYDGQGRLLEKNSISIETKKPHFIETFQYNSLGKLIAYTMDNINSKIFHKTIYTYDTNSNKIEEGTCSNYKGIRRSKKCKYRPLYGYTYNDKNQLTKEFYIGNWSSNTETHYQYDEYGNQIDIKGYDIKAIDTVLRYHFVNEYDEYDNVIVNEQKVGNPKKIDNHYYKYTKMSYDVFQNLIRKEYVTEQNKLLKIIHFSYTYDSDGNWVKREKYEGNAEQELKKEEVITRIIEYY